jgi:hypothetical protein
MTKSNSPLFLCSRSVREIFRSQGKDGMMNDEEKKIQGLEKMMTSRKGIGRLGDLSFLNLPPLTG